VSGPAVRLSVVSATARDAAAAARHAAGLAAASGLPDRAVQTLVYPANRRGLCAVYNDALRRAEGEYVALVHDDVSFERAPEWATRLAGVLERHVEYSVLGVAGASILQDSGCWLHEQVSAGHIYHRRAGRIELTRFAAPHRRPLPAAALDGVFLFARTADVRELVLDEQTFDGFHFYDMELAMQARARGLRLAVTGEVDLIHESTGSFGPAWERDRRKFAARYAERLPASALEPADLFPFREFSPRVRAPRPVAVLIPAGPPADQLRGAVLALRGRTAPEIPLRIYVLDADPAGTLARHLSGLPGVRHVPLGAGGQAALHNRALLAGGPIEEDLVLFHDGRVEAVNDVVAHLLAAWEQEPASGVVAARLHARNGLIEHAGLRVHADDAGARLEPPVGWRTLWNFPEETRRGVAGGTLALALVERDLYRLLGGLDEHLEPRAAEADFNLRAALAGRQNALAGDAVAIDRRAGAECAALDAGPLAPLIRRFLAAVPARD